MKKLLLIICLLSITFNASSQIKIASNVNTIGKRCGKIINKETGKRISSEDLMFYLDEETYSAYNKGRILHIVSIPFWCETAALAALATTNFIMANNSTNGNAFAFFCAMGFFWSLGTVMSAIPATTLTICSNAYLKKAVHNYNSRSPEISLNFGATNNGIGFMLKF